VHESTGRRNSRSHAPRRESPTPRREPTKSDRPGSEHLSIPRSLPHRYRALHAICTDASGGRGRPLRCLSFRLRGEPVTMTKNNEICRMDAVSLAAKVRKKELSAVEVTEAVWKRMDVLEPHLHSFCMPTPDVARAAAKAVDAKIAAGEDPGVLAGVPVGIKDLVATKGIVTAMGSPLYKDFIPDEEHIVVERLKAAGAMIIGKTNVPELGYSGVGHNPIFDTT